MKRSIIQFCNKALPLSVRKKVLRLGFNIARDEFDLMAHEHAYAPSMDLGLRKLAARGLQPKNVVDVGAFQGDWSRMARQIWPQATLSMVEANDEKQAHLEGVARDVGGTLHMALLGPESGQEVTFFVMESGSSVLEENSPLERKAVQKTTRTLDEIFEGAPVDFLKMDVQGFELEVLRGAPRILAEAQAVLLEVSLIEINAGAPLFAEVVTFMSEAGFDVADILELHRRPLDRATNQVDLLFARKESPLLQDKRHYA